MCVVFVKNKRNTKTEQTFEPSPLSCPAAGPHRGLSHPGTGPPSCRTRLPSRPRCPSDALRAILRRFQPWVSTRHWRRSPRASDWLTAPQGPLHVAQHVETRQDTRCGVLVRASRPCRQGHGGCDLNSVHETEITSNEAEFRHGGNRSLPSAGPGEGVRPHARIQGPHEVGPRTDFPHNTAAMELSTNPAPALSALAAGPPFYK